MTGYSSDSTKELTEVLGSAAMYNDKGYIWMGHSPAKRAEVVAEFQVKLLRLLDQIGPDALEPALVQAILSGAAARDEFGQFCNAVGGK